METEGYSRQGPRLVDGRENDEMGVREQALGGIWGSWRRTRRRHLVPQNKKNNTSRISKYYPTRRSKTITPSGLEAPWIYCFVSHHLS